MSAQENLDKAANLADQVHGSSARGSDAETLAEALQCVTAVVTNLHLQVEALTGRLREANVKIRQINDRLDPVDDQTGPEGG